MKEKQKAGFFYSVALPPQRAIEAQVEERRRRREQEEARRREEEEREERRLAAEREAMQRRYEEDVLRNREKVRTRQRRRDSNVTWTPRSNVRRPNRSCSVAGPSTR